MITKQHLALIGPNPIFLGFSGGKDSLAFAHALSCWHDVTLIHVNNGLEPDEEITQKALSFADTFKIKIDVIDSPSLAGNCENACREARMRAFEGFQEVVLCHHLGDAVENYLRNVLHGFPEYKPMNFISVWGATKIIRPFLMVNPVDINNYLNNNGLKKFVAEDPLNQKSERHWMRKELIPLIHSRQHYNLFSLVLRLLRKQFDHLK